ncbi:MAG: TM2 domain-containing protein [Candidatus Nanopelagicales bacterium]
MSQPGGYPQPQPPFQPVGPDGYPIDVNSRKLLCGLMGIFFGSLGIHRFLLGDVSGGVLRIVISILTCGIGSIVGFIEGIIYLSKSDPQFYQTYMVEKKAWF